MAKTKYYFDWSEGHVTIRTLSKSFDTVEEAKRFAEGKTVLDIFRAKGRYKVEWLKKTVQW